MPSIRIVKFKVRRGSDSQRKQVILEQGELGYTTDTRRLFVGNGSVSGGELVGNKVHDIQNTSNTRNLITNAYQNDIVYENNFLYQLTGTDYSNLTSWGFIGSRTDNGSIEYSNSRELRIKDEGVTSAKLQSESVVIEKLNPNIVYNGGGLTLNPQGLSANINSDFLEFVSNNISIKPDAITSTEVASGAIIPSKIHASAINNGLSGGDGNPIGVLVDNNTIQLNANNELAIKKVGGANLKLGPGITLNSNDEITSKLDTFAEDFIVNDTGAGFNIVSLVQKLSFDNRAYTSPSIIVNDKGLVTDIQNNICLPLSSNHSQYGGFITQLSGSETSSIVSASTGVDAQISSLSSAGFMVVRMGIPNITTGDTRSFVNSQYLAIPVFTLPDSIINIAASILPPLKYPYPQNGFRAYDETSLYTGTFSTAFLTSVVCSGFSDYTGFSENATIYTDTQTLSIGTKFAISPDELSAAEVPTLSGWWSIDDSLYFVNESNSISITGGSCFEYPHEYIGFNAADETTLYTSTSTSYLTAEVCAGFSSDIAAYRVVYSNNKPLVIGSPIATTKMALSTTELPTESGWWAIGSTLYFVNSSNIITLTGSC